MRDIDEWVGSLRDAIRLEFERDGQLRPRGYVLGTRGPQGPYKPGLTVVFPTELSCRGHKNGFVGRVRELVRETDAVACVFAVETWVAEARSADEGRKASAFAANHSLENWPGREEAIMVTLEQVGIAATRIWSARIVRNEKGVRLEEFKEPADYSVKGRFAGLMPKVS